MKTVITGGTGFVGSRLKSHLLDRGHEVTVIGTHPPVRASDSPHCHAVTADTTRPGPWQASIGEADLVVNLTGRTIFKRWSRAYKQQIYDSRILTTRQVVAALSGSPGPGA